MQVIIENRQKGREWTHELETVVNRVLEEAARRFQLDPRAEVGVTIVDNEEIRELNSAYRGIDSATDVLSFALNEDNGEPRAGAEAAAAQALLLGDIVISLEQAAGQAEEYGHSLQREVAFLAVHGLLHLLGFDHQEEAEEREMMKFSEEILSACRLSR